MQEKYQESCLSLGRLGEKIKVKEDEMVKLRNGN
jgi:hypothetical protein